MSDHGIGSDSTFEPAASRDHHPILAEFKVSGESRREVDHFTAQTYPGWQANARWWQFLDEAMQGGPRWLRNLSPHLIETRGIARQASGQFEGTPAPTGTAVDTRDEFELRKAASARINLVADVIQPFVDFVAQSLPQAGVEDPVLLKLAGERMDEASLMALADAMLRGIAWRAVDSGFTSEDLVRAGFELATDADGRIVVANATSEEVRERMGDLALPITWDIHPSDVRAARFDERTGELLEILIAERVDNGESLDSGKSGFEIRRRFWTRDRIELWRWVDGDPKQAEMVEGYPRPNVAGRVTVFDLWFWDGLSRLRRLSWVEDWALVDRWLADQLSSLGWSQTNASDPQTSIFTKLSPDDKVALNQEEGVHDAATSPVGIYDPEARVEPVKKGFEQASLLLETFWQTYERVLQLVGLGNKLGEPSGAEAAAAKMQRFAFLNATLSRLTGQLGRWEREILGAMAQFLGLDPEVAVPTSARAYPTRFDVRSPADITTQIKTLTDAGAPRFLLAKLLRDYAERTMLNEDQAFWDELDVVLKTWIKGGDTGGIDAIARLLGPAVTPAAPESDATPPLGTP